MPEPDKLAIWMPQDPMLQVVFLIGIGIIFCSLLMLVAVFILRVRLLIRQHRERFYEAQWQPLLAECVLSVPKQLPQVPRNMRYRFLRLWNFHYESLVGGTRSNLEALAGAMRLENVARTLMDTGNFRERMIAVMTLGHLRDRTQWHELRALVADPSPILSLLAARALLDIDASATLVWLVTVMAAREDWPLSRVVTILKEVGPDMVTTPLITATDAAVRTEGGGHQVARLLRMMEVAHTERVAPVARRIARDVQDPELIAAALRLVQDPRDLDIVRVHAGHEAWYVRASAMRVLGRIGGAADQPLLIDKLGDGHWWVRYRAARALLALPGTRIEDLEKIRDTLDDRYAADILTQAIAEARAT